MRGLGSSFSACAASSCVSFSLPPRPRHSRADVKHTRVCRVQPSVGEPDDSPIFRRGANRQKRKRPALDSDSDDGAPGQKQGTLSAVAPKRCCRQTPVKREPDSTAAGCRVESDPDESPVLVMQARS